MSLGRQRAVKGGTFFLAGIVVLVGVAAISLHSSRRSNTVVVASPAVPVSAPQVQRVPRPNVTTTTLSTLQKVYLYDYLLDVAAVRNTTTTTTTTTLPPRRVTPPIMVAPRASPPMRAAPPVNMGLVNASGSFNGMPCGGNLPSCCTMQHESHGDQYAVEPGHRGAPYGDPGDPWHHASGLWQFMPGTWNTFMGYPYAAAAPAAVQNEKARQIVASEGFAPWYGDGCYNGR